MKMIGGTVLVAFIALMTIRTFFPWIPFEMAANNNGYTVAGCDNQPSWIHRGSIYDCSSYARKRYDQHVNADFQEMDKICDPDRKWEFEEFTACSKQPGCELSPKQRRAMEADWRACKGGVNL
jgi:hypothetical protein